MSWLGIWLFWITPALLGLLGGLTLGRAVYYFRQGSKARAVQRVVGALLILASVWVCRRSDPTSPSVLSFKIPPFFVGFAVGALVKKALGLPYIGLCGIALISLVFVVPLAPFQMRVSESTEKVSPTGRYRADLVYLDGLAYGYGMVTIHPTWDRLNLLGRHRIAEVAAEGLESIRWVDDKTLQIRSDGEAEFVIREDRWSDIRIRYVRLSSSNLLPSARSSLEAHPQKGAHR